MARASLLCQVRWARRSGRLLARTTATAEYLSSGEAGCYGDDAASQQNARHLLNTAAKNKDIDAAWRVFEGFADLPGQPFNVMGYNILLGLLVERPTQFLAIQGHMERTGVQPDEATLTLQVRRLLVVGELDAAAHLVWTAPLLGVTPKRRLFSGLLDKLAAAGRLAAAAKITTAMADRDITPAEEQLVSLAEMCARAASRAAPASLAAESSSAAEAERRFDRPPTEWLVSLLDSIVLGHDTLTPDSFKRLGDALPHALGFSAVEATVGASDGACSGCGASLCVAPLSAMQRLTLGETLLANAALNGQVRAHQVELLVNPGSANPLVLYQSCSSFLHSWQCMLLNRGHTIQSCSNANIELPILDEVFERSRSQSSPLSKPRQN